MLVIIVFIRPQVEAHESWYNQTIKAQGCTHDVDECIEAYKGLWDYEKNIELWCSSFGRENVQISCYQEPMQSGQLESFFLSFALYLDNPLDYQHSPRFIKRKKSCAIKIILQFK